VFPPGYTVSGVHETVADTSRLDESHSFGLDGERRGSIRPSRAALLLAVLMAFRIALPLVVLMASGSALPLLPRYNYEPTPGDA
jgi:hypothetical protein